MPKKFSDGWVSFWGILGGAAGAAGQFAPLGKYAWIAGLVAALSTAALGVTAAGGGFTGPPSSK